MRDLANRLIELLGREGSMNLPVPQVHRAPPPGSGCHRKFLESLGYGAGQHDGDRITSSSDPTRKVRGTT
jgi:hypothetical protein